MSRCRIGVAELDLRPRALEEETFNGVNRPFVASLYKGLGKKGKDSGSERGYVLSALGLSERKGTKQKSVGEYFKQKSQPE